jgi:hypothetical protein
LDTTFTLGFGSAVIFSDDAERIRKLKEILAPYCAALPSAPSAAVHRQLPDRPEYPVIVVSGLLATIHPPDFFRQLRQQYPRARIIFIIDTIEADMEIEVRAAGTLFVGSLDYFQTKVFQRARIDTAREQGPSINNASDFSRHPRLGRSSPPYPHPATRKQTKPQSGNQEDPQ